MFCSAAPYGIPQNLLVLSPKCLTLNLWLWSPCQPPPSFACWGLPLAVPSCGGDHVYLEIACTLASNCHINCFVIIAWYQAGSCRQIPLLTPLAWLPWPSVGTHSAAGELTSCHQHLEMVLSFLCVWIGYVLFILHPGAFNYSQQVLFTLQKSCSNFSLNCFLWGFGLDECTCSGVPVVIGL